MTNITTNRRATFDYELGEHYEAGIELLGSEVKTLRTRGASIVESYVEVKNDECWLVNANIDIYEQARVNHEPKRRRKLLLHRKEIDQLTIKVQQRGYTIVPVKMYFNSRGRVKVEIALGKGKHTYDKRRAIRDRIVDRETQREMKNSF